ncbi:MAG: class I SAM-dependent methyltransferase [Cyanobacteriota bacterium]|nr:class I SAM-dependent methyltransferase [Cyanobacteriota bacterium]
MSSSRFSEYMTEGFSKVQGWVNPNVFSVMQGLVPLQNSMSILGGVCEIGVHHGKFFIGIHNLNNLGHKSLAIDIFDEQHLNIDSSGKGNLNAFQENVANYCLNPDLCSYKIADSLSLNLYDIHKIREEYGLFRIFSIDGGHTAEHTINDWKIAEEMTANGGVIIVDDYYNPNWPGVHEGIANIFISSRPKFAPFLYSSNKMFFTTASYHKRYIDGIHEYAKTELSCKTPMVKYLYGHKMVCIKF